MIRWNNLAELPASITAFLDLSETFAPGDQDAFLTAIADALKCDRHWCDCGSVRIGHWPLALPQCGYHADCPCGGTYDHKGVANA